MSSSFFTIRDKSGAIVGLSSDPSPAAEPEPGSEPPIPEDAPEPAPSRLHAIRPGERPSLAATLGTAAATSTTDPADQANTLAWWRQPLTLGVLAVLAVLALLALLRPAAAPAADVHSPASATATTEVSTAAPMATLPHAIIAYAAPGGQVVGPLDGGRVITPTARCCGDGWLQLDAGGLETPNLVWVEAGQLPGVALGQLADLTPPTPVPTSPPPPAPAPISAPQQPVIVPQPIIPAPQPIERCEENLYGRVCSTNPALITQGLADMQATGVAEDAARAAARTAGQP